MKWIMSMVVVLLVGLVAGNSAVASAEDIQVEDLLRHADQARGNLDGIVWNILITTNEDGGKESREMTIKAKRNNSLVKFTSPAAMNDRMVLMVDRNMWFIRSGLKKPVSLSPRQKLVGDAVNGDIASTNYVEDYSATLLGEEAVKGEPCYVLDLKATNTNVTYDRIKYWVAKERHVGIKAHFFTLSGKLFKTAEFVYNNHITIPGQEKANPFISELIIKDAIETDRVTTMTYSNIRLEPVPETTFNLNVLVR